jgi:antitoxin (DNA-binding transcriptional repressor) of toxin-antitoxin stability system
MEKEITATEAVRDFSNLLNRIKFGGDHYIIKRGGKPVAYMGPLREGIMVRPLEELELILNELPELDDELETFAADLENLWRQQPSLPEEALWE